LQEITVNGTVIRHNGKLASSRDSKADQEAISKKAGKKAGGLLSGGGGGATNKVAKVSLLGPFNPQADK
jgi:hypothetical protein